MLRRLNNEKRPVIVVLMLSGSLFVESSMSCEFWVYGYGPEPVILPYNENPTRALKTTSLKCCLPSTDATDRREIFKFAHESSQSPHVSALHWNPPGFRKKKVGYFSNNENPTRALNNTSLKCCLPSTDAIERWKKCTQAYEGSRSLHASALH